MVSVAKTLGLVGGVAGIGFHHLYARRVEIDFILLSLFRVAGAVCLLSLYICVSWLQLPLTTSLHYLLVLAGTFTLSTAGSILVYRAHFHRLKHVPGPYLARVSTFWTAYKASGDYRFHVRLQELHAQYGDVTTALGKSTFWAHAEADDRKKSFATSRDPEDHRVRRRPWEVAFSPKHLSKQDAVVQQAIGLFIDRLAVDSASAAHAAVNITDAISRLTFDVTGIIGFGHSFGATTRAGDKPHPALTDLRKAHAVLGTLRFVPWLLSLLLKVPGGGGDFASFLKLCEDAKTRSRKKKPTSRKKAAGKTGGRPKPVVSFLLDALERGDPSAAPTPEALADESRSMIAAGADTTQSAMTNVLGFVAARRDIQAQLQKLVDVSFPQGPASFTYAALLAAPETLGWIDAVIHETLRIQPSAPTANPRVTPPQGLEIDESVFGPRIWIPGDVEIVQSPYVIHRDARWFERPDEFLPERWFTGSNIQCDRGAYFPFHLGKHACIGKPMAMEEMRSVLARLALQFDMDLAPGQDWGEHQEKIMDHFTMSLPPLHLTFHERTA
ncbi:uncharacterized protein PG998_005505 [Apiospora kogelbergensis]|uniref:uncharacterized protein n=1 Tax=Apiospora kogelbergensis TaxID=1337665 RepID=UPI00312E13E2